MTAAIVKGTDGMTRQARGRRYSKQSGESEIWEYRGPLDEAETLYTDSKEDPEVDDVELRPDAGKPVATVTVTYVDPSSGTTEDTNAIWEVDYTEIFRDLRTHPYFTTNGSIMDDLLLVDEKIKNGEPYAAGDYTTPNVAKRYFGLRRFGVEGYYQTALVLRKTLIVSGRSQIQAAYADINSVVTLDEIDPPSALIGSLSLLPTITGYANNDAPGTPTFTNGDWEWLKKTPRVRSQSGGRRYEIAYEWWGADSWSTVLYQGTFDPDPDV